MMVQINGRCPYFSEGETLEECRKMLKDALSEMIIAYKQQGKEIPVGGALLE